MPENPMSEPLENARRSVREAASKIPEGLPIMHRRMIVLLLERGVDSLDEAEWLVTDAGNESPGDGPTGDQARPESAGDQAGEQLAPDQAGEQLAPDQAGARKAPGGRPYGRR